MANFLIIAASSAMGMATSNLLEKNGDQVFKTARTTDKIKADILLDASDFDAVDAAFEKAINQFQTIDGVVCFAGSLMIKPAHLTTHQNYSDVIQNSLTTAFATIRSAGKYMKGGSVVLVSSAVHAIGLANHEAIFGIRSMKINIRPSQLSDIFAMVSLSKAKRMLYEKAQPQFWCYAGEEGDRAQGEWFKELLEDKNDVMFTAESETQEILGFIIGKLMPAPEVYNPGGLTLMIDDFCVQFENLWQSVGASLIEETKAATNARGATQIVVVCGAHDYPKRKFLSEQNLSIVSEWFVGDIV
jgi:hypothetical protein